jgi:TolA-binding protein
MGWGRLRRLPVGGPLIGCLTLLLWASLAFGDAGQQVEALVRRYALLDQSVTAKDYRQATRLLQGMARDFGSSEYGDELRFMLAESYFNLGDYVKARDQFLETADHPRYGYIEPEAMYGYAIASIMLGSYDEAESALQRMVKRKGYEDDPRANFAFGVLRYYRQDYEGAVAKLGNDSLLDAVLYLGKSYAHLHKPLQALLAFKQITAAVPGTALATLAHFSAGEALFLNADFEGALAKFKFFLDNFSDSPLADFAHYFLGCAQIHNKQYEEAISHLMPLTKHANNFLAAHANYFVGYCNLMMNKPRDAVVRFQKVRTNYPKTRVASYANLQLTQALLATGDTAQTILSTSQLSAMFTTGELQAVGDYLSGVLTFLIGQYDRSANFFENILIRYPQSPLREPACAMLLQALNTNGKYMRAVTVGAKYVKDFPDSAGGPATATWRPKLLYGLAEGYYYSHQFVEAEDLYRRTGDAPGSSDIAPYARLGRAFSFMQLDRTDEAIQAFQGVVRARPADSMFTATVILGLGYAFYNKGEFDSARLNFEYVSEHHPGIPSVVGLAYFYAGMCYRKLTYFGVAITAWSTVVNKYPDSPKAAEAGFRAGDTYFKGAEYEKAISLFRFVTEHYPNSPFGPPAQAFIGQCYYNQKQYPDAIREHQKFLDLYATDPQAQSVRSSLQRDYYKAGLDDSTYMAEFMKRYPESELGAQARFDHALALMVGKDYGAAAQEFQTVVVNFPGSSFAPKAQLNTGECYAALPSWEQSAAAYRRYLDYFPNESERDAAYFNLGISQFNLGDFQKAQQSFRVVVDSFPNSQYTDNAKKNVALCAQRLGTGGN